MSSAKSNLLRYSNSSGVSGKTAVIDALALMTHDSSVPYMDYVKKISGNALATKVKLADLRHNSDLSRLDIVDAKALARVEKYTAAIQLLESVACQATK